MPSYKRIYIISSKYCIFKSIEINANKKREAITYLSLAQLVRNTYIFNY